jgi:S-adenosylmethionine synthetase
MMQSLIISPLTDPAARQSEIVERKGLGHPDTICDALAEEFSRGLCRFYLDRFGFILHHNVDKVLLWGGISRPSFGGGEIVKPIEIFLAGRATQDYRGVSVPVTELAIEGTRSWLRRNMRHLDADQHVIVHSLVRPGSADLVDLYDRQRATGAWLANDTSVGVGFAPLSPLEQTVLAVERAMNAPSVKQRHPMFGEDVKVMGARHGTAFDVTLSCAFIDRYVSGLNAYIGAKSEAAAIVADVAARTSGREATVSVNAADDVGRGSIYLTVTGTSAEAGDDGEAGRGNRFNGLITPYRPMTMESVAGKNPVTHVGKLYNALASMIADAIVRNVAGVIAVECYLLSRIGRSIRDPALAELRVCDAEQRPENVLRPILSEIVGDHLAKVDTLWRRFVDGPVPTPLGGDALL